MFDGIHHRFKTSKGTGADLNAYFFAALQTAVYACSGKGNTTPEITIILKEDIYPPQPSITLPPQLDHDLSKLVKLIDLGLSIGASSFPAQAGVEIWLGLNKYPVRIISEKEMHGK
ncbi:uncharacterized protein RCO7_14529 [Rhynchosporium graminicola]|uniref:Uncharacterized protein n=1 Tax=Rhynchosporium graminicola TaxID=2792576 RepID=A0A1E1KM40_9HELO|nr:uncharacterized protein RCO7_14529 [Rhynchosporium commune]